MIGEWPADDDILEALTPDVILRWILANSEKRDDIEKINRLTWLYLKKDTKGQL